MLENPLKEVLVKKANFFDMLGRTPVGSDVSWTPIAARDYYDGPSFTDELQNLINPDKLPSFRDGAELIAYLSKDPNAIRYLDDVQDLLGKDVKLQDVLKSEQALTDFARNRIYKRYGLQNYSEDQLSKLTPSYKDRLEQEAQRYVELVKNKLTPSIRSSLEKVHKNTQVPTQTATIQKETTPAADLTQNPLTGDPTINLDDFAGTPSVDDALAIANQGVDGKTIAPAPAAAPTPAETPVETPAPAAATKPVETNTPAGLTREETMQFLEQGYVPTSNGGFMLHEQQAANMLKSMQQSPDYNPGQTITDASRLNRIRNNMLGNQEYTAQGRQQAADDMVYQKAMYHKNRQSEIDARNNAALEQHRGKLVADARTNYLNTGKVDYQRSVLNGAPLTPAAQYYQAYSNAEIDGKPAPALPAQVQNGIAQGMHKFRGQLAAQQKPAAPAPVNPRNPNYYTQQEMDTYAKAHAANNSGQQAVNTVSSWDPNRLKAAQERHNNAISGNNQLVNPLAAGQTNPTPTSTGTTSKQTSAATSK